MDQANAISSISVHLQDTILVLLLLTVPSSSAISVQSSMLLYTHRPQGLLGTGCPGMGAQDGGAQDVHLHFHAAPELRHQS